MTLQRNLWFQYEHHLEEEDRPPDFDDEETQRAVTALYEDGFLPGWCGAVVTCLLWFRGEVFTGADSLWGCSYESEKDLWKNLLRPKDYDLAGNARRAAIDLARRAALLTANDPEQKANQWKRDSEALLVAIDKHLEKLDAKYREPLILYYLESMDYKEISDILQIPVSTVGVRLARARGFLKQLAEKDTDLI